MYFVCIFFQYQYLIWYATWSPYVSLKQTVGLSPPYKFPDFILQACSVRFPCKCGPRPLRAGRLRGRGSAPTTSLQLGFRPWRICEIRVSVPLNSFENRDIFVPTLGPSCPSLVFSFFFLPGVAGPYGGSSLVSLA